MRKRSPVLAISALTLLALLAACVQTDGTTPDEPRRHPFGMQMRGEDGTQVSLDGYTDGYRAGAAETLSLGVTNNTDAPWYGRLCLQLLEPVPSSTVFPLLQEEFDLQPGGGFVRDVTVELPADLSPGPYGLALVVHTPTGPLTSVTTVQVGEDEQAFQGEWPAADFTACPAP